jgi:hypothetical protein
MELLSCSLGKLRTLPVEGDGRAELQAMLALVKRPAVHPDTFRFEALLLRLKNLGRFDAELVSSVLSAIEAKPGWVYGGVLLALHAGTPQGDAWVKAQQSKMDESLREITEALVEQLRPQRGADGR